MSSFYERMTELVLEFRKRLAKEGVPYDVIDRVMGNPGSTGSLKGQDLLNEYIRGVMSSATQSTQGNYSDSSQEGGGYGAFEGFGSAFEGFGSGYQPFTTSTTSTSSTQKRLPPNDSHDSTYDEYIKIMNGEKTKEKASSVATADATSLTGAKYPQSWIGKPEVVVIIDYSDKVHAIFGDFVKTYVSFKNDYLKPNNFRYGKGLMFGAGWTLLDKTKLSDLRKALKNAHIPFRELKKDMYIKELSSKNGSTVTEISETSAEKSETSEDKITQSKPSSTKKSNEKVEEVSKKDDKKGIKKDNKKEEVKEKIKEPAKKSEAKGSTSKTSKDVKDQNKNLNLFIFLSWYCLKNTIF